MPSLTAGQTGSFTLDAFGYIDIVALGDGTLTATSRAPNLKSNVFISKLASVRYGPYGVPMDFVIACTNGTITYSTTTGYGGDATSIASDGAPSGGNDGDLRIRTDKPFSGVPYKNASGVWTALNNEYTWAGRPTASSYSGAVIWVTDWNQEFFSDGTNWIPVGKRLQLVRGFVSGSAVVGSIAASYTDTSIIPAGLVIAGCDVWFHASWSGVGSAAIKNGGVYLDSTASTDRVLDAPTSVAAHLGFATVGRALVVSQTGASNTRPTNSISSSSQVTGSAGSDPATGSSPITHDWTAATSVLWTGTTTSADSLAVTWRAIEIFYP